MRAVLFVVALACVLCGVTASDNMAQFMSFINKYNKTYANDAEFYVRFNNFVENMGRLQQLRKQHYISTGRDGEEVFGITKFSDMSREEFKAKMTGFVPSGPRTMQVNTPSVNALPSSFDWRTKHVVTPVKNQEQCGSCWAFSTTEEIESSWAMQGKGLIELSVQQIVSCDTVDQGCNGGDTITAYQYVEQAGGLELDSEYPYTSGGGDSGSCSFNANDVKVTVTNYSYATPGCSDTCDKQNEELLLENLVSYGPVSICVDAEPWQFYSGGVLTANDGCSHAYSDLDHCVQLVGYDKSSSTPYYIIRNSWGTDWGYDGYIYVEYGHNVCGVADEATLATTAAASAAATH